MKNFLQYFLLPIFIGAIIVAAFLGIGYLCLAYPIIIWVPGIILCLWVAGILFLDATGRI